ncbi:MAG: hypothetical protein WAK60_00505 [Sedimentisphaerales bacterium]
MDLTPDTEGLGVKALLTLRKENKVEILLLEIDPYDAAWEGVIYNSVVVHQVVPEPTTYCLALADWCY